MRYTEFKTLLCYDYVWKQILLDTTVERISSNRDIKDNGKSFGKPFNAIPVETIILSGKN